MTFLRWYVISKITKHAADTNQANIIRKVNRSWRDKHTFHHMFRINCFIFYIAGDNTGDILNIHFLKEIQIIKDKDQYLMKYYYLKWLQHCPLKCKIGKELAFSSEKPFYYSIYRTN